LIEFDYTMTPSFTRSVIGYVKVRIKQIIQQQKLAVEIDIRYPVE